MRRSRVIACTMALLGVGLLSARAGEVGIVSWQGAGELVFNESSNAASYRVEWAPAVEGPWRDFSMYADHGLDFMHAAGSGVVTAAVPMFYRVVAMEIERSPIPMIQLPGGTFLMGNLHDPLEGAEWERPIRTITLDPFHIAATPVTESQWRPVYNWALENGYGFDYAGSAKGPNHPVVWMNWYDIVKWCNAKSVMDSLAPCYTVDGGVVYTNGRRDDVVCNWAAEGYRLPTEAEWEYAARGGTTNRYPWGDRISNESNANYNARCVDGGFELAYDDGPYCGNNPKFKTGMFFHSPVDEFPPNDYGLFDVIGNAMEWVWDWMSFSYYEDVPVATNPRGPDQGVLRTVRGGSYMMPAHACRVSYRIPNPHDVYHPANGFRVARSDVQ